MPVQTGTWQAGGVWDAVAGRVFTDALNEGLARAAASRAHAPAGRGGGRDTPFVAAVLSAFEARLPAAPTRAQKGGAQEDGKAQKDGAQEDGTQPPPALLVRHARWSLLAALGPGVPPPVAGGSPQGTRRWCSPCSWSAWSWFFWRPHPNRIRGTNQGRL